MTTTVKLIIRVSQAGRDDVWVSDPPGKGDVGYHNDIRQAYAFKPKEALALFEEYLDNSTYLVRMYELRGDPPKPDLLNPRCFGNASYEGKTCESI